MFQPICPPVRRYILFLSFIITATPRTYGQPLTDSAATMALVQHFMDSIDATIPYVSEGTVDIFDAAKVKIPDGYKFIPEDKARMIIEDLWGNPKDLSIGGMIVKSDFSVRQSDAWTFVVSYDESGYVKDDEADDIDYDKMLKDIQASEEESNKQRAEAGYPSVHLLGWAAKPFYDKERKILHWARKLHFGTEAVADEDLTLNYDIRILGRKGVLSLNAVGTMSQLAEINHHIPDVLNIAEFKSGYTYEDFDPSVDKVAAYTIGGLIAGKLIAKTGLFILLLKYIKVIAFAIFGVGAAFRKKLGGWFSRKKTPETNEPDVYNEAIVAAPEAIPSPATPEENNIQV